MREHSVCEISDHDLEILWYTHLRRVLTMVDEGHRDEIYAPLILHTLTRILNDVQSYSNIQALISKLAFHDMGLLSLCWLALAPDVHMIGEISYMWRLVIRARIAKDSVGSVDWSSTLPKQYSNLQF